MSVSRRLRRASLASTAGVAPVLLALALHGQPPAHAPALQSQSAADPAALQTARLLDGIAQDRFASARMVVFGTSRIVMATPARRHALSMAAETPAEAATLKQVNSSGRPYLVAFLHCASVPEGTPPLPSPMPGVSAALFAPPVTVVGPRRVVQAAAPGMVPAPAQPYLTPLIVHPQARPAPSAVTAALVSPGDPMPAALVSAAPAPPEMTPAQRDLLHHAQSVLPGLMRGQEAQGTRDGWTYLLSPVRASGDTCLSCHVGAKRGDTLGVMAYAVRETPSGH